MIAALPGVTPKASRHGMWLLVAPDTILRWRRDLVRRQVVIDDQPRHQRQLLLSQPGPSRAAPQLVLAVQAIAGERGGDPTRYTRA